MASAQTDITPPPTGSSEPRHSSVLIVLVVRDGAAWLPGSLAAIAGQTYDRLGVIAVDCGSSDRSRDLLQQALGEGRILSLPRGATTPDAFAAAVADPRALEVDYLLLLHDDAALAPDAVERLVETAEQVDVANVGIVGAKVVGWDDPRSLLDVGVSADRSGHPYSPLEPGEIDHGQHDRVREVFAVDACCVLISRNVWTTVQVFDGRLAGRAAEVDYCWRARVAGFHVLWSPSARVRHAHANSQGARRGPASGRGRRPRARFHEEQGAVASTLKNYRLVTLLWLLPLVGAQAVGRWVLLIIGRRFEEAWQLALGWGWNLLHLPGTLLRRRRVQHRRRARDASIRPYMITGAVRLRKWLEAFERVVPGDVEIPDDDAEHVRLRAAAASAIHAHPVATAWIIAAFLGVFATRHLWSPAQLTGGAVPIMPARFSDLFAELLSGVRTAALGGQQAASPALGVFGGLSWVTFGSPAIAERVLLAGTIPFAALSAYRFLLRPGGRPSPAVIGAACYALSPLAFWGFSQGRVSFMVAYAVLPRLADRIGTAVGTVSRGRGRFVIGTGAFLALGISFWPGIVLPTVLLLAAYVILPEERRRRFRGLTLLLFTAVAGAALAFPVVVDLVQERGLGLSSFLGTDDPVDVIRAVPGAGAWAWPVGWFIVIAAILGFALAERRAAAVRFLLAGLLGAGAAWASVAGYLPTALSNAPAYLALVVLCDVALITLGLSTALGHIAAARVGPWKLSASALVSVVAVGLVLTALFASYGPWEIGRRPPAAWPIVANQPGTFRVLWVTGDGHSSFPAPGGDPQRRFDDGADSVWWAITDRTGASILDIARNQAGPGYEYVDAALMEARSGTTHHLGALLVPAGIRAIVLPETGVPAPFRAALDRQFDLEQDPAESLDVYLNAHSATDGFIVQGPGYSDIAPGDLGSILNVSLAGAAPLSRAQSGWSGAVPQPAGPATSNSTTASVWVGDQGIAGWRVHDGTGDRPADQQLGWGIGANDVQGDVRVVFAAQWLRTAEVAGLVLLWLLALWITRKPVRT